MKEIFDSMAALRFLLKKARRTEPIFRLVLNQTENRLNKSFQSVNHHCLTLTC
jgi:hypothetical protein